MRGYLAIYATGILIFSGLVIQLTAQEGADERAARLRAQLADLQAQQSELQTRLAQIDEDIKPENIERSLAGIGSTHPEDLREARRRQLEIQRKGIQSQLDSLAAARTRLEATIAAADLERYRATPTPGTTFANPGSKAPRKSHRKRHRLRRDSKNRRK
jgi:cell division protein FtsB